MFNLFKCFNFENWTVIFFSLLSINYFKSKWNIMSEFVIFYFLFEHEDLCTRETSATILINIHKNQCTKSINLPLTSNLNLRYTILKFL